MEDKLKITEISTEEVIANHKSIMRISEEQLNNWWSGFRVLNRKLACRIIMDVNQKFCTGYIDVGQGVVSYYHVNNTRDTIRDRKLWNKWDEYEKRSLYLMILNASKSLLDNRAAKFVPINVS